MNKIHFTQLLSIIFGLLSLLFLFLTKEAILSIGQDNFNLADWQDVDIYLLKFGVLWLIISILLNLLTFIYFITNKETS